MKWLDGSGFGGKKISLQWNNFILLILTFDKFSLYLLRTQHNTTRHKAHETLTHQVCGENLFSHKTFILYISFLLLLVLLLLHRIEFLTFHAFLPSNSRNSKHLEDSFFRSVSSGLFLDINLFYVLCCLCHTPCRVPFASGSATKNQSRRANRKGKAQKNIIIERFHQVLLIVCRKVVCSLWSV